MDISFQNHVVDNKTIEKPYESLLQQEIRKGE